MLGRETFQIFGLIFQFLGEGLICFGIVGAVSGKVAASTEYNRQVLVATALRNQQEQNATIGGFKKNATASQAERYPIPNAESRDPGSIPIQMQALRSKNPNRTILFSLWQGKIARCKVPFVGSQSTLLLFSSSTQTLISLSAPKF